MKPLLWAAPPLVLILAYLTTSLHPGFGPVIHPERYSDDESAHEAIRRKGQATVAERLFHVDGLLEADGRFFDQDTVLEPYLYGVARWADDFMDVDSSCPGIAALRRRLENEAAHRFALEVEGNAGALHPAYRGNLTLVALRQAARATRGPASGETP